MKTHTEVTSSRRKSRKAHFAAPSHIKYRLMSAHLSKDLRKKYNVRAMPVRKDDEVTIVRGSYFHIYLTGPNKGSKGKVTVVYRKKWIINIEKLQKMKANGMPYQIPVKPCQCIITKPKLDKDRQDLLKRKAAHTTQKNKGDKHTAETIQKKIE